MIRIRIHKSEVWILGFASGSVQKFPGSATLVFWRPFIYQNKNIPMYVEFCPYLSFSQFLLWIKKQIKIGKQALTINRLLFGSFGQIR
jgi:hypothetical protein